MVASSSRRGDVVEGLKGIAHGGFKLVERERRQPSESALDQGDVVTELVAKERVHLTRGKVETRDAGASAFEEDHGTAVREDPSGPLENQGFPPLDIDLDEPDPTFWWDDIIKSDAFDNDRFGRGPVGRVDPEATETGVRGVVEELDGARLIGQGVLLDLHIRELLPKPGGLVGQWLGAQVRSGRGETDDFLEDRTEVAPNINTIHSIDDCLLDKLLGEITFKENFT